MRNSSSHQLVSKHSILSAQRKNKVAAMKVKVEESAPPEMEESDSLHWFKNEALPGFAGEDPIGWISKAERFFEEENIRSSHKTQWAFMRMEGAAQVWFFEWCQEDLDAEWESFAVDLIRRFKEPESEKTEERRETPESEKEEEGWNEDFKVEPKSQNSEHCSELFNQELMLEARDSHLGRDVTIERTKEESETKNNGTGKGSTSGNLIVNVAKPEGVKTEVENDHDGRSDVHYDRVSDNRCEGGGSSIVMLNDDDRGPSPEQPACGATVTEGVIFDWKEQHFSLVTAAENVLEKLRVKGVIPEKGDIFNLMGLAQLNDYRWGQEKMVLRSLGQVLMLLGLVHKKTTTTGAIVRGIFGSGFCDSGPYPPLTITSKSVLEKTINKGTPREPQPPPKPPDGGRLKTRCLQHELSERLDTVTTIGDWSDLRLLSLLKEEASSVSVETNSLVILHYFNSLKNAGRSSSEEAHVLSKKLCTQSSTCLLSVVTTPHMLRINVTDVPCLFPLSFGTSTTNIQWFPIIIIITDPNFHPLVFYTSQLIHSQLHHFHNFLCVLHTYLKLQEYIGHVFLLAWSQDSPFNLATNYFLMENDCKPYGYHYHDFCWLAQLDNYTQLGAQTASIANWKQLFSSQNTLSSFIDVKAMRRYATPIDSLEIFARVHGVSYIKNGAATTFCFLPKNGTENRAFDPGGSSSISCIAGITKTTCDDLVVLPNGKEMQVQVYVVGSYVDGDDFWATTLVEIGKKYGQESIREYELVTATLMCGHLTILIRQWDPGQLKCPRTTTAYGYHWLVFFNCLGSLNCVFDIGSSSVSCIVLVSGSKLWDPGEPYLTSCIIGTSCFELWDPGGRLLSLEFFRYFHLEDKVNFEGGSIDENIGVAKVGQTNRFGKVFSRRGKRSKCYQVVEGKVVTNYAESANGKGADVHTFGVN